jgi:TetR/AcrR family transcriptional repressor of nem operon
MTARYLSAAHRDNAADGCPLAGLAAELGRNGAGASRVTSRYLERVVAEAEAGGVSREKAISEVSRIVGALLLARMVKGEALSDEILAAGKGRKRD